MAKVTKTETVTETRDRTTIVDLTCDLCGASAKGLGGRWETDCFHFDDVDVMMQTRIANEAGANYPGDVSGVRVEFDICPDCFNNRLVPWLREQGAEPTIIDW